MTRKQNGFTLIETAIVLVIIGMLAGTVMSGQELITTARVRGLISQQDSIQAAYLGFRDRYGALPGDYSAANVSIPKCSACEIGNNDGQILTNGATIVESIAVWEHLSKAGFITGKFIYVAGDAASPANTPANPFGSPLQLIYDSNYSAGSGVASARHNLKTGNNFPSDIMAEVDRKIDDGLATSGKIRYSSFSSAVPACAVASGAWNTTTPVANCGAASLL